MATFDHDNTLTRDRGSRLGFFILTLAVVVGFPTLLGVALGNALGFYGARFVFGSVGFGFGIFAMIKLLPRYWVVVPQTMAFVTTNQLAPAGSNPNVPYGPGGHFTFPWELREESGNITLDTLTLPFSEKVPTKTAEVTVHGSLQFKFNFKTITRVVELDISTIERGFLDIIHEFLSEELSEKEAERAKDDVRELRVILEKELERRKDELLRKFNAVVEGVQIASVDLPPAVQKVRDTLEEARSVGRSLYEMLGFPSQEAFETAFKEGKLTTQDIARAREQFLVMSDNATMNIQRIDATGLENARVGGALVAGLASQQKKEK